MTTPRENTNQDIWLPTSPFSALRHDMDSIFERYLPSLFQREPENGAWMNMSTKIDLCETEDSLELEMDAPGIAQKDIDITLNGQTLTVSGEREDKREEKSKDYHRVERSFGSFRRQIALPCEVDEDKIEASLKDGVLKIAMPKTDQAKKSSRKIPIKGL